MGRQKQTITKLRLEPDLSLPTKKHLLLELEELRAKLAEAEETLRAIRSGEVDAVVVSGPRGEQLFTLRGAEYAYRALVEAMNEGAATLSLDGTVLYCNQRLSDLLEIPAERIIGVPAAKLVAPGSGEEFAALFANALAGQPGKAELRIRGAGGENVSAYVSLGRIEEFEPAAVCMVVTDLTEHKQRDELIAAGELARSILASAAEAIAVCDNDGIIISANHALISLCGFNPLFQPFDTALSLQVKQHASGEFENFSVMTALAGESFRSREVGWGRKDGTVLTLLLSAARVAGETTIAGCVVTLTDITDRRNAEKALIRNEKLAALGRLAATIAHEVNNPLAAAMNSIFIASSDPSLSAQTRSALEIADQELRRAAHITSRTLGFYRDQHNVDIVELPKVIDEVVGVYARRLQERGIKVQRRYRCWSCPQACFMANAGELRQVISNLLMNGMDAIRDNGSIHIRLVRSSAISNTGPVIRLTVADNGSGIRSEHLKRIFEPFFTTKERTGTGLGMWISQEIVRRHGGSIRVRSKEGEGTVFCVTVPAMAADTSSPKTDGASGVEEHCAASPVSHSRGNSPH